MESELETGVGVIITNKNRNLFYFQQKDETYWIKQYQLKYCFFGGGIENREHPKKALERELFEELDRNAAELVINNLKEEVFTKDFINIFNKKCRHTIFESILSEDELKTISKLNVKEGKRGVIIKLNDLNSSDFFIEIWNLFRNYLPLPYPDSGSSPILF